MSKFVKQVFQGKSIYRILFNQEVEKHCQDLTGVCLDLAGGDEPSYHQFWTLKSAKMVKTDIDTIDFNQPLPVEDGSVDNVFLFNAIYIVKNPEVLMKEVHRILKPGGKFFMSSPFIFNEAREPDDFRRLTSQGLEVLLKEFSSEIIPFGERATSAVYLLHNFFIFNFIRLIAFTKAMMFDKLIPKKIRQSHPCPLGYFVIAKKHE